MPSTADLIFLALLIALTFGGLQQRLLGDAGTGWHIRNGEHILQTHSITRQDYFSYTKTGQPWFAWEWLSDVLMAAIHRHFGLNGVVFLSALLIATTFAGLFRVALARSHDLLSTIVIFIPALMASSIHFLARPHLFTWLFTLIWWVILERLVAHRDRSSMIVLLSLPVLMLLWVNLHGGFLIGLVLLGIYFAAETWNYFRNSHPSDGAASGSRLAALGTAGVLSFAATFVNPYGYKLWIHLHEYLSSRFYMDHIQEFLSTDFHGAAEKCFAAVLLLSLAALAFKSDTCRPRPVDLLLILFSVYAGLYARRNIPIASILLVLTTAPLLADILRGSAEEVASQPAASPATRLMATLARAHRFSARMATLEAGLRGHLLPVATVIISVWICAHNGYFGARQVMSAHFDRRKFPVKAANFLGANGVRQQVFTPDSWGGYLIYQMYPQYLVFMDDRHDFYGEPFVKDYIRVKDLLPGWDAVLNQWKINWVLIPPGSALSNMLKELPEWRVAYDDGVAIIFQRVRPL